MLKRKNSGTKPGPGVTSARGRASSLVAVGRSLPPTGSLTDMAAVVPAHFWQSYGFKKWRKRVILFIVALILAVVIFVGYKFWSNISKLFGGNIFGLFSTTKLRGEDSGHVNILLAGYSADDPGHQGADLTDSIMIVSLNTRNNTAFLLSVPRDLWVRLGGDNCRSGENYCKINEAFEDGEGNNGDTNAGMSLLANTLSSRFGLPIDYWALVNYQAIKDAVNAVGGIDVTIKGDGADGVYDPDIDYATGHVLADYTNGVHHLNGEQALDLARARGDAYGSYGLAQGDYDRTQYQRQMLIAVKDKAASAGVLANPITLANLLDAVGNNVKTDFNTSEIHRLYDLVKPITGANVKSYGLNNVGGKPLVQGSMYNGQSIQEPVAGLNNYSQIQQFVQQLLNSGSQTKS